MAFSKIEFTCHACEKKLRATFEMAGQSTFCPSCGRALEVPIRTLYVETPPPPRHLASPKKTTTVPAVPALQPAHARLPEVARNLPYVLLVGSTLSALWLWTAEPSLLWGVSYILVIVAVFSAAFIVQRFRPNWRRLCWVVAVILSPVAVSCYYSFATYTERWTSEEMDASYTDTYSRDRKILKRIILFHSGDELLASGGFSDSEKLHGPWTYIMRHRGLAEETRWYWYGETITEGEWHLRNGD